MRVIHFDVGISQKGYTQKKSHDYFELDVNTYLENHKSIQADIVTCFPTSKFTKDVLDSIQDLKLVITRSVGMDNIDTDYCDLKGIRYVNIEYSRYNVAHHTMAFILFHTRQFFQSFEQTKLGTFCHENIDCLDLKIRTLGIIGYGKIGKEVAELADAFGIKVIACDRKYRYGDFIDGFEIYDFDDLIAISDIISLHCDANATNKGLINNESIQKMKNGVALINTARGSLINENDVIRNIEKFSFIGLDVLEDENHFSQNHPLLKHKNVFITPHTAYKSEITTQERWDRTYSYIEDFSKNPRS